MRALTVRQPHASLIVLGLKPVENRGWRPRPSHAALLIGPHDAGTAGERIAIHAAKAPDDDRIAWAALGGEPAPRGAIIGGVTIVETHHANECAHDDTSDFPLHIGENHTVWRQRHCSPMARPAGCHWTLADPVAFAEPIPMRGSQGLWHLDPAELAVDPR